MKLRTITLALICAGFVTQPILGEAAPRITTIGLGTLGGSFSSAYGLNDYGQVVGDSYTSGDGAVHAFIYKGGALQDLGTLGGTNSFARAINNSGQVVGYSNTSGIFDNHAFFYNGSSLKDLGTLGGTHSYAYAINDKGQVAGYAYTTGNATAYAFIYNGGSLQNLGGLGGRASYAQGINNSGQVTGFSTVGVYDHAFLYGGGSVKDLGTLAPTASYAQAINDNGQVAGYAYNITDARDHAFLYSGGSLYDLGTLGGTFSSASGINNSGQVVGSASTAGNTELHATLWSGGKVYDLNKFAPSGWTYNRASAINSYGQVAGTGTHNGFSEAYLLTLHPDWNGGDGYWDDYTNSHWNYGELGAGALGGLNPGLPHDVVIKPTGSATIYGSTNALVRSLVVGGTADSVVTLKLNGGTTATNNGATLQANAVLAGSGRLSGNLTTQVGSTAKVVGGETMQITNGTFTNAGKVSVLGTFATPANLEVSSATTNQATGQISLQNANVAFSSGINNSGQFQVSFGNNNVTGQVITLSGGKVILSGNSTTTFYDNVDIKSGGELRVSTGSTATFFGLVNQRTGSIFSGSGTKYFEGGLSIGGSPGLGVDSGSVVLGDGNEYLAEIGGLNAGSEFDHYIVGGKLTFGGTLKLVSWNGFTGEAGQSFDLFDWGTYEGSFSVIDVSGLKLAVGTVLNTSRLYNDGVVSVQAVPEPEGYALFLAGFGVLGLVSAKRKQGLIKHSWSR